MLWTYLYWVTWQGVGHRYLGGRQEAALVAVDMVMCLASGKRDQACSRFKEALPGAKDQSKWLHGS